MALSDLIITRRGGTGAALVRASAIRASWEVNAAGILTADLPLADLRAAGLPPTDLVGYWVRFEYPTLPVWGGEIQIGEPSSDGLVRITAETFHTLAKGRFTTPPRSRRRQRPTSGTAGALFRRALNDINARYPTLLVLGEIEESGPVIQPDWDRADFYDTIAPSLTTDAGNEWDVSADRIVMFRKRLGRDRTGSVRLAEGIHIADFVGPTTDKSLVENLIVARGQYRARHRGHSRMFNPAIGVYDQASIDRYGLREGERDFGRVRNLDALRELAEAELARTKEPAASLRVTLAPAGPDGHPDWTTFALGDTVRVALGSIGWEGELTIKVMTLDGDRGTLELAGEAVEV